MHPIKDHLEVRSNKQPAERVKVKEALHQGCVLVNTIYHFYCKMLASIQLKLPFINRVEADGGQICHSLETTNCLCLLGDCIRQLFRGRAAVGLVKLDAEVASRAARSMTRCENDCPDTVVTFTVQETNHVGGGRGAHEATMADNHFGDVISCSHFYDSLDGLLVIEPAVACHHQRWLLTQVQRAEDGLNKVLQVELVLLEDSHFFAKTYI